MRQPAVTSSPQQPIAQANPPILPLFNNVPPYPGPAYHATNGPNIIANDESIVNILLLWCFCRQNHRGCLQRPNGKLRIYVPWRECMFFALYHYETNSILATPITTLDDKSIFDAYKANFEMLEAKGYKPKVNMMDNQATKSGNRKDLKCVVHCRRCLWSVSIDSHVRSLLRKYCTVLFY